MYKIKETAICSIPLMHDSNINQCGIVKISENLFIIYFKLQKNIAEMFKTNIINPVLRLTIEIIE